MSGEPKKLRQLLQLATDLGVPLEIVTEKVAILGQSGAGKTYTAMRLAELLLEAGLQVIVLDLVGCWWGLRAGVDGQSGGLPILVIGGQHGDLPLSAAAGAALAELVVQRRLSAVFDLSELDPDQLLQFAQDFGRAFFEAKKRAPSPVHVLLEEAHELLAEDPAGKLGAAVHATWVRVCKLGRNYGIGYTLVSQEPQALSKRALGQVGSMIAMRTQGEYAQRVVLGWAKTYLKGPAREQLEHELPAMETGEAFIASPFFLKVARRTRITRRVTFDSSRTPEIGEDIAPPATLAPVEVQQLREQFADLVEELEAEDPAALQRQVEELRKELAEERKKKAAAAPPPPPPVEVPVLKGEDLALVQRSLVEQLALVEQLLPCLRDVQEVISTAAKAFGATVPAASTTAAAIASEVLPNAAQEQWLQKLPETAAWLLRCLLSEYPGGLTRKALALKAGRSLRGGAFIKAVAALKRKQLIVNTAGVLTAAPELFAASKAA